MPQPAGPQDAEAFVGRARELAVLSAARFSSIVMPPYVAATLTAAGSVT